MKRSKGQRLRANRRDRKEADAKWLRDMGPMPEHIKQRFASFNYQIADLEPWQKAPEHMLDQDGLPSVDPEKIKILTRAAGKARSDLFQKRATDLTSKHSDIIGRRGAAGLIVRREAKEGKSISLRSVQKYLAARKGSSEKS